jgi:penicillin G amidase
LPPTPVAEVARLRGAEHTIPRARILANAATVAEVARLRGAERTIPCARILANAATVAEVARLRGAERTIPRARILANAATVAEVARLREAAPIPGSNNWALAGQHTAHGGAIVADDMHLRLSAPNIWYRAQFVWSNKAGGEHQVTGATLPGAPVMVVGSNGHIAWGFTNSQGDWADLVVVETDPKDSQQYRTPDGPRAYDCATETIHVRGQADELFEITSTIWGPIIGHDAAGHPLALRWTAHDPAAVNLRIQRLEQAATLDEALAVANTCGAPPQNFVVADDQGQIAWTILGRIPRRVGLDGRVPRSWADGSCRWDGWLEPDEYPRIAAPAQGRIWTANGRVVGGDDLAKIGDGGYDLGARATQIRDRLAEMESVREADMLTIQLDNRGLFYEPWRKLMLELLTDEAVAGQPLRDQAREHVRAWHGRADPDSVGFRLVHAFWRNTQDRAIAPFLEPLRQTDASIGMFDLHGAEAIAWRLVSEQPPHLLDPEYETWNALLLAACDDVLAEATTNGATLDRFTWGGDPDNVSAIGHPLGQALPALSRWLDMPHVPLSGSRLHMPRVHMSEYGASQRMAVSPGREEEGYFHMPCGQSGHPLSPHYRDGHEAWMTGKPTPFLPGPAVHTLRLQPSE